MKSNQVVQISDPIVQSRGNQSQRSMGVREWALQILTEEEYEAAISKSAKPAQESRKRKPRTRPPEPTYEQIRNAVTLPLRLAPQRFLGTSESAFRHMFHKHMPEFLNPKNGQYPEGFAACIVKISERKYALNCPAYEAFLSGGHRATQDKQ